MDCRGVSPAGIGPVGDYQTDIPTFPANQAPGTHWYHPHKHGSTAVQLINGMAGALLVEGAFDDYLWQTYNVDPDNPASLEQFEKVLLVQQLWEDVLFWLNATPYGYSPYPLVNGQLVPTLTMRYGEVQRWRFVSATTNSKTQLALTVPASTTDDPGLTVKQIAQDGVQFAPENYTRQPLGNSVDGFELSPGNRIDLLVKAPNAPADGSSTTFFVMQTVIGKVSERLRSEIRDQNAYLKKKMGITGEKIALPGPVTAFAGPLIKVVVSGTVSPPMQLPTQKQWPAMPQYLADLKGPVAVKRTIAFSMSTKFDGTDTSASPASKFFIDGEQYNDECSGQTMVRGDTETWTVTNTSTPAHPFHIHVNPFQVLSRRWRDTNGLHSVVFSPPYPWMDTIALKPGTLTRPSVTRVRQRFDDYTGAYVIHCHFLGHEDRGMMSNVQTVCDSSNTTSPIPPPATLQVPSSGLNELQFGTTVPSGGADDCTVAATDTAPLGDCPGIERGSSE